MIFFFIVFISFNCFSQECGIPLLKNYPPEEYHSEPQVWAITQDQRGIMYFGVSDGILEYDGVVWRKIPTPKKQVVRSLDIDRKGKVFAGANNDFGYLEADATGSLQYVSLSKSLDSAYRDFDDVWKTIAGEDGVYFSTNKYIFRYQAGNEKPAASRIKVFKAETGFFLLFKNGKEVYTFQRKKGLYRIGKDTLETVRGGSKVRTWFMAPYEGDKALVGTNPDGLFVFDPSAGNPDEILSKCSFDTEALYELEALLNENQLYHGIRLDDGRFALATIRSGIVIIDRYGKILQHIYKENGLQSQTVHYLFQDRQGALWAALTYGISRLETHYPVSTWDEKSGLTGSIYNVVRHEGKIYSSSNLGLHYLEKNKFYPVEELAGKNAIQVFDLKTYKISGKTFFLASATHGIWEVTGKHAINISKLVSFGMYQSPVDSGCIFVPDGNNLFTLEHINGKWIESKSLATFPNSAGSLAQVNKNELWCVVDNKPVLLQLHNSGRFKKITPFYFNETCNPELKDVRFNAVTALDKNIYFMTGKGIFTFNSMNKKFIKNSTLFNGLLSGKPYDFIDIFKIRRNFAVMIKKENRYHIISVLNNGASWAVDSSAFKRIRDIELYYNDGDSLIWFVSAKTLYRYDLKSPFHPGDFKYSLIRNVSLQEDSVIFNGVYPPGTDGDIDTVFVQPVGTEQAIPYKFNNIIFHYAVPEFDNESYNEYSYFLEGDDKQEKWSNWSNESKKEFTNLGEGNYVFRVKARNIFGKETGVSNYSFTIISPWYRTIWAYIFYITVATFILWALVKLNVRRLEQAKKKLEQIVKERTAEILEQKEEILQQKEEIMVQSEQLEANNKELEKLSLVATETDNAVLIADANGNIEWVNPGFTRLYGFTTDDLVHGNGPNIIDNSSCANIKELLARVKETGKSCSYESLFNSKYGEKIWAQTTLSPIFNEEKNLIKIVAIDSNITKQKVAEEEIRQQREEIKSQRDEIESQRNLALNQRDEIVRQKAELTDSIRYALQIQISMLPSKIFIKSLTADYFVFYKPRDIVSGDFYWINEIEGKVIVSVGDCTGHGVPGAFMSLLGITFLKEIIVKEYITHPAVILNRLRKEVIKSMKQQGDVFELKDGMDIAICVFDKNTKTLEFSGANNSAIIVRGNDRIELKADRMPIGIYETMRKFSMQSHDLREGDILYLYTDGFQDQFGGNNGKKFRSGKFKKMILGISHLSFKEQEAQLEKTMEEWKKHYDQVDDITVLGMKFF